MLVSQHYFSEESQSQVSEGGAALRFHKEHQQDFSLLNESIPDLKPFQRLFQYLFSDSVYLKSGFQENCQTQKRLF